MNIKILSKEMICPISKKSTLSFREYFEEAYIVENKLNESPQNIGHRYPDIMDNMGYNKEDTLNTISNGEYIESITLFDVLIDVYCIHNTEYYFIDKKNLITIAYVFITPYNDYIKITGLWKYKAYKTIMADIFKKYIIPKFKFIISDELMSDQGINFWRNFSKMNYNIYEMGYIMDNNKYSPLTIPDLENVEFWENPKVKMYIKEKDHGNKR